MYSEQQGANQSARMRWPIGTYVVRRYLKTHFGLHNTLMTLRRLRLEILGDFGHPYK